MSKYNYGQFIIDDLFLGTDLIIFLTEVIIQIMMEQKIKTWKITNIGNIKGKIFVLMRNDEDIFKKRVKH